jgi:ribosome-binding factor A
MSSRRLLKAAEAIREVVGMAILADLKDPRIRDVTVTHVEVAPDMRQARVHVSIMGDETRQNLSLRGLQSAAGFLQAKIAEKIDTRYTPKLIFVLDLGVKKSIEMARLLREVLPPTSNDDKTQAQALPEDAETEIDSISADRYNDEGEDDADDDEPQEDKKSSHPR